MARRNATAEALSYLRGKRYQAARGKPGGTGANQHTAAQSARTEPATLPPGEQLAAELHVGLATLKRDAQFARQVDGLAAEFGSEVRRLILSRDARLTRTAVARLVRAPKAQRRAAGEALLATKQWPRPNGSRASRSAWACRPSRRPCPRRWSGSWVGLGPARSAGTC
jgi:hypothetical protein